MIRGYQSLFEPCALVEPSKASTAVDCVMNVLHRYDLPISLPMQSDTQPLQKLSKRLGLAFEVCVAQAVAAHPQLELLATNIAVRNYANATHTTLGELDMLVRDTQSGTVMHWELALKFYVGVAEPLTTPSGHKTHWPGPRAVDCFERKHIQLTEKQIALSSHPSAQQTLASLGLPQPTQRGLLSLGVLFQPLGAASLALPDYCNPSVTQGQWCRAEQWRSLYAQAEKDFSRTWVQIPRLAQIAPHAWWRSLDKVEQKNLLQTSVATVFAARPEMWLRPEDGGLMMVLPCGWPETPIYSPLIVQ